ncbi:uncharacterized protein LOC123711961 [Pieris brassicae]|nr:uncharacterized protein LOC123711961 [Pieris brassicae]
MRSLLLSFLVKLVVSYFCLVMAMDGKKPRNIKKYCLLGCPDLGFVASAGTSVVLEHDYWVPRMNEAPVTLTDSNSSKNIPDEGESISVFAKGLDTQTSSSKENKDQDKSVKYTIAKVKST